MPLFCVKGIYSRFRMTLCSLCLNVPFVWVLYADLMTVNKNTEALRSARLSHHHTAEQCITSFYPVFFSFYSIRLFLLTITTVISVSVSFHVLFLLCGLQKMDTTARAVLDIMTKTTEYLQPNPGDMKQLCTMIM